MDETYLEIREYQGEGYQPLVDYGAWRVAMLRFLDSLQPEHIDMMERHMETDEVFVLLCGQGELILGGNQAQITEISPQAMEPAKIYNIKRSTWHTILLSRDASVLIVENRDTREDNSEYISLRAEQRRAIQEIAKDLNFK